MKERIEEIVKEACGTMGVSLYDLQWKPTAQGRLLLVKITRLGGVAISDCQQVSRLIEAHLEEEDLIESRYYLEVSSPGLERELTKKSHFISAIAEKISVTVHGKTENQKLTGILQEVNPSSIRLNLETEEIAEIPFNTIKKAKTLFDAKQELQQAKLLEKNKE